MQSVHEFSHFGFLKCYLTTKQRFYWVNMSSDFKQFIDSCLICQQIETQPQQKYPLTSIPVSYRLFDTWQIDFHSVKQEKKYARENIYRHVLECVDQFSQFVVMIPTKDQTATSAARELMDNIILKFGCFRYLISDRESSWLNDLFQEFLKMPQLNVLHYRTSPYKASSNGLCEGQNHHIVRVLRAYCSDKKQFHEYLLAICAGNGTVNTALGFSSYFLVFGQEYRWPIDTV